MVKNPPAMQEMQVQSLGQEDPLEEEMATHSSILAWRIPWTEEPGGLQSMGSQRVENDLVSKHTCWYTEIQLVSHTAVTTSNVAKFTSVLIICLLFYTNKSGHLEKKKTTYFSLSGHCAFFLFSPIIVHWLGLPR